MMETVTNPDNILTPGFFMEMIDQDPAPRLVLQVGEDGRAFTRYENQTASSLVSRLGGPTIFNSSTIEYFRTRLIEERNCNFQRVFKTNENDVLLYEWDITKTPSDYYMVYGKDLSASIIDSASGVYNRNFYEAYLDTHPGRVRQPTGVFYIDANNLKTTNDCYGHDFGDKLIKTGAIFFKSLIRDSDIFCRVGGDEFVLFLNDILAQDVHHVSSRLEDIFTIISINRMDPSYTPEQLIAYEKFLEKFYDNLEAAGINIDEVFEAKTDENNNPLGAPTSLRQLFSVSMGVYTIQPEDEKTLADIVKQAESDMTNQKTQSKIILDRETAQRRLSGILPGQ